MKKVIDAVLRLFGMENASVKSIAGHEGGWNEAFVLTSDGKKYVLRISALDDRTEEDYLAETEFVHYLAENGAAVADVIPSHSGKLVETVRNGANTIYASLFEYAPGILISDNGYRYREGAPLSEYFFNTGKTLGRIHALSKSYKPIHRRMDYSDKYNMLNIERLMPDEYADLKSAIALRLDRFSALSRAESDYGLVHFDFSDGNYHIDMENGNITVYDFDNAIYCWYMFDLANLWTHGVGWCQFEKDPEKRRAFMTEYFKTIIDGYRSETDVSQALLEQLPLFIDMVLIENIVDEFECCVRAGEEVDPEDIEDAAQALIHDLPWAGFFED